MLILIHKECGGAALEESHGLEVIRLGPLSEAELAEVWAGTHAGLVRVRPGARL